MTKITPRLPSGMRDFLPQDMLRRQYVIDTVARTFQTYGYEPFQTPVMELEESLMGKYGPDAEKLIFYAQHPGGKEKLALRYDLTVPLARAFGMHEGELSLPFRRYQIAPVWRAERPQRGRYREFYQCDADCVGIPSMVADAEAVAIVVAALRKLGFGDFVVKVNNRKLLTGIGIYAGLSGQPLSDLYRTIDKLDKVGPDGVREELGKNGIDSAVVDKIMGLILSTQAESPTGYSIGAARIGHLRETLSDIPTAQEGLNELAEILDNLQAMNVPGQHVEMDFAMVRGLSYYTGAIFECALTTGDPEERVGSVAGGGRYDDLIGLFRKESIPTVGISLGIERLIVIMDKRNMYPPNLSQTVVNILVTVFGPETRAESMRVTAELRDSGIPTELYMQDGRLGKQFGYADKRGIPLVAILGQEEIANGVVKVKRLSDQNEISIPREQLAESVRALMNN